jgi:hypothetical protein
VQSLGFQSCQILCLVLRVFAPSREILV